MNAAGQRVVQVPEKSMEQLEAALRAALRLSAAHDQLDAAKNAADAPGISKLTKQLGKALHLVQVAIGGAAPPERADLHIYTLEQLTPEFVRQLMLDRGWQSGRIVVGSAQGETLARRLLMQSDATLSLVPLSAAGQRTEDPNTWALVEG